MVAYHQSTQLSGFGGNTPAGGGGTIKNHRQQHGHFNICCFVLSLLKMRGSGLDVEHQTSSVLTSGQMQRTHKPCSVTGSTSPSDALTSKLVVAPRALLHL